MAAMMSQLLVVLYTGLCAGRGNRMTDETLPKPSLSAWPSWIMPPKSNVTLQCHTSTNDVNFALRKGNVPVEFPQSPDSTEGMARFLLTDLQASSSGLYTCEYYRRDPPQRSSQPSDILLLLVTGEFSKPSLQAHQRGVVTARENVTLQCQRPNNSFESVKFALLKAGAAEPIRVQGPAKKKMNFSLRSVTVSDAGNYSCVYFLMRAPFWASEPSNHLEITVKGTVELTLIVIFILLFILGVFLIYKYTQCGAAPNKMTKCSRSSKDPQEQRTSVQPGKESDDLSMAITSCSPALDKASQVSRAEEPHTVTYAELNTRALREGLSRQMEQPLETCVYSTLKA
ncbi:T-cell-interacting, activating receptor on myeloid cells protein 1-like isoform X3 [Canis lupus familiaris]|uniref:Ig-like domain-containing protein n=1 Tax=Canis lupus familiaris TaxID=9615 RepID=A0A8P0N5M1_CANLF|nr:T-cell-interacting, activating receptor on myeloid cells protein 1-like isoform X3 [Canis lupus familiaris]XP_038383774.1 T-cell-interacting, activating receptor on myeloid cells protein 1-like isoform X3 [Canis lupus familiaris]XP_038511853.1 T-cell-interacting, activating receptor on myeloid cells protein 1-like isoform X3 [Canis lupus familiaris]|eukprot:XP_013974004.1 T-cell-interacting, activating receptor on myeloid cells protein 1-like isoform X3 [Canis lupus familiaris]